MRSPREPKPEATCAEILQQRVNAFHEQVGMSQGFSLFSSCGFRSSRAAPVTIQKYNDSPPSNSMPARIISPQGQLNQQDFGGGVWKSNPNIQLLTHGE